MLKWIEIIASFMLGKMQPTDGPGLRETAISIFEEITYRSRKTVSLIVISLGAAIFALGGFFISLINATTQYDKNGVIAFSSTFVSGLILIAVAIGTFAWVFGSAWPGTKKFKESHLGDHKHNHSHHEHRDEHQAPHQRSPSSLEYALSALVMDFVKERELRRGESASAAAASEAPDFRARGMRPNMDSSVNFSAPQDPLH